MEHFIVDLEASVYNVAQIDISYGSNLFHEQILTTLYIIFIKYFGKQEL